VKVRQKFFNRPILSFARNQKWFLEMDEGAFCERSGSKCGSEKTYAVFQKT